MAHGGISDAKDFISSDPEKFPVEGNIIAGTMIQGAFEGYGSAMPIGQRGWSGAAKLYCCLEER